MLTPCTLYTPKLASLLPVTLCPDNLGCSKLKDHMICNVIQYLPYTKY